MNHLPCFCYDYITFAPNCQQEDDGFHVKYPICFLCNLTVGIPNAEKRCQTDHNSAVFQNQFSTDFSTFQHAMVWKAVEKGSSHRFMISSESSMTVNGPSLHNSTCISAPKMPDSTTGTRSRQYALQDSYSASACAGGAAWTKLGRLPLRQPSNYPMYNYTFR